jgi:transcriptional regulator with XRE-family HTH domain
MDLRRVFAENLRAHRTGKGMSQEALADAAGLDRTYISALERERYSVSLDTIGRLANALQIEPAQLLALRDEKDAA